MGQYIIAYFGGEKPSSPEDSQAHMENFMAWTGSMGKSVVNQGTPLKGSTIVTANGTQEDSETPWTGFSVVQADSMETALEFAKKCPHLNINGIVRVAEIKVLA